MIKKPRYQEIYESSNPDDLLKEYLDTGIIDSRYVAGYTSYSSSRVKKLLTEYLPDKERPDRDFVLIAALTVLDCGCKSTDAMDYAAKILNKDEEYVTRMKHETVYKMRDIVRELAKHPYKTIMQKQGQWNGVDYKKKTTASGLTNKLYKDRCTVDTLIDHERRITQLERQLNIQSTINNKILSKTDRRKAAIEMREKGATQEEIAKAFDVSVATVKRMLNGHK